jgi:hypothetical protein
MKNSLITAITRLLLLSPILIFDVTLSGQTGNNEKNSSATISVSACIVTLVAEQARFLKNSYSVKNEAPKELINGKEYESYYTRSKIKPLLFPDKAGTASAITRDRRYDNLILQYDTYLDEVIYTDASKTINFRFPQIALNKNIIDGFNLYFEDDTLLFKNFRLPECSSRNLKEGFYEVVYKGESQYIIKHESSFYEREGLFNYKYSPVNYISTRNEFYPVKNRKSLLRLMGENSKDIKKFLHISGIRIRQAGKDQFVDILKYYDTHLKVNK